MTSFALFVLLLTVACLPLGIVLLILPGKSKEEQDPYARTPMEHLSHGSSETPIRE